MLPTECEAAVFELSVILWLVLGPLSASPLPTPACLGSKDAKRVQKARQQEKRLLIYVGIAQKSAATLWYCLSSGGTPWREAGIVGCQPVGDILAVLGCVEKAIAEELAAWRPGRGSADAALLKAQHNLWLAKSDLRFAEEDAQRPALGLAPVVPNRIKSRRQALEDLELTITRLVGRGPPP
jgi:hypothetical protein